LNILPSEDQAVFVEETLSFSCFVPMLTEYLILFHRTI